MKYHDVARTERIFVKVITDEMCLEQRAHLCIARTAVIQDEKVYLEASHIDENGKHDKTENACCPVS